MVHAKKCNCVLNQYQAVIKRSLAFSESVNGIDRICQELICAIAHHMQAEDSDHVAVAQLMKAMRHLPCSSALFVN